MEQEIEYVIHQTLTLADGESADVTAGVITPDNLIAAHYIKIK